MSERSAATSPIHAAAPIPFIDLHAQRRRLGAPLNAAIRRVLEHGAYIMGPEVFELEKRLTAFCGAKHAVSCSSGTDAIILGLLTKGVGAGDAVLLPSFTFAATAEPVSLLSATPVFVDVLPETYNLDPNSLALGIQAARNAGLRSRGVIAVDLFGQPADYQAIETVCAGAGLWLMADAAQSFGASYRGRRSGAVAELNTTSFFPAKPLGCYGDGGAILTDDDALAKAIRSLRVHGQGSNKYENVRVGVNGRLDTIQAAILIEKLEIFAEELETRERIASRYTTELAAIVGTPKIIDGVTSSWAQYTIRVAPQCRDTIALAMKAAGVPTAIYYPKPLHQQPAYQDCPVALGGLPVSERLAGSVLSLPMHPYLDEVTQGRIVATLREALSEANRALR